MGMDTFTRFRQGGEGITTISELNESLGGTAGMHRGVGGERDRCLDRFWRVSVKLV